MSGEIPRLRDLRGQETAVRAFRAAQRSGRVGGAYLLHGPSGVGRALGAHLFACALLCETPLGSLPPGELACGACRGCRWNAAGTHPDLLEVSAETGPSFSDDGAAARSRLDAFTLAARREAKRGPRRTIQVRVLRRLVDLLTLVPAAGGHRVVVLDAFDDVEEEGTATLLKVLEDSPPKTTFLLLATDLDRLPDTIRSRCQRLRFRPLPPELVGELIGVHGGEPGLTLAPAARKLLVRHAQGSVGRALDALAMGLEGDGARIARDLLGPACPGSEDEAVAWVQAAGRELAAQRVRLRALLALAFGLLREQAAGEGDPEPLERLLPALRHGMESVGSNVTPELVLRSLWVRARQARARARG